MRLSRLHVQNFRSAKDSGEFTVQPLFALIGENNSGKSNLLHAVEILVSAGAGRVGRDDFNDPRAPIVIKGELNSLSDTEKKRWRSYLVENRLILEKHIWIGADERAGRDKLSSEFHGYRAEPTPWHFSLQKIQEKHGDRPKWLEIVKEVGLPDYFIEDGKCNKSIFAKALERYLDENEVEYDKPDLSHTQALGLQSNVVASLPSVHLLPAITDYSDEIDRRSTSSTFRRLMGNLSERILEKDPRFVELQRALDTIRGLLNRVTGEGKPDRITSLAAVEAKIAELLQRVMPSVQKVCLEVEVQEITDMFSGGVSLAVDDGVETNVLAKGHGLQRCIVFTLLQTLILNERNQLVPAQDQAVRIDKPIILLVEEPELYIHPQLGKLFFDVMRDFSKTDQVVYSTHSPLFVDAYESEQVAIVTKASVAEGTKVCNCDVRAFDDLDERKVFQGFTKLNPAINELFFARRVLLVEGPEDLIAITAALQKDGLIKHRVEELDWSVIPCGGKQSIPFFQRVLNAFQIPYAVLYDLDIEPGMAEDKKNVTIKENNLIGRLAGTRLIHTFPVNLERSLGLTDHFRDQYDAHKFFLIPENITEDVVKIIQDVFA